MLNKCKKNKKIYNFLVFTLLSLILVPYGGEGYYKVSNAFILVIQALIISFVFILNKGTFKIDKDFKILVCLFGCGWVWQLLSDFNIIFNLNIPLTYADLSELARCFQLIFPIVIVGILLKKYIKIEYLLFTIFILIFSHTLLMFLPKITPTYDFLVELYGEGHYYTAGYARYRGFGIIGQPGKAGMFSLLILVIALLHYTTYEKNPKLVFLIVVLSFISIALTLSRISLIFAFISLFTLVRGVKFKTLIFLIIIVSGVVLFTLFYEVVEVLVRGIDVSSGRYATASHRMVLKEWALEFISQNFTTLIFGMGDTKDYISQFSHPYAFDLSLRTPDSSHTVWLVRYGLIGMLIWYLPLIYKVFKAMKASIKFVDKIYILYIPFLVFVLSFVDPFYHDVKLNIIASILYYYFFQFLKIKRLSYVNYDCRPIT